jgi:hypothetical protein
MTTVGAKGIASVQSADEVVVECRPGELYAVPASREAAPDQVYHPGIRSAPDAQVSPVELVAIAERNQSIGGRVRPTSLRAHSVVMTADFPTTLDSVSGLSLRPDGTRLYTSISERPFDIWMLEGFR